MKSWLVFIACFLLPLAASDAVQQQIAQQRHVAALLQESYVFVGGGSGVMVDPKGLILTNDHVAGGKKRWRVRLADGRAYWANRIGTDPYGDICLLEIEADEGTVFTYVPLGDHTDIRVGTTVLAIGNPFSLGDIDNTPTVTKGTLGTGRVVRGNYTDCLQVDAAVNPGNSGGPLLNVAGKLLGINGQIRTNTGMRINSGIGLAITCTQLADFLPHLKNNKTGYLFHTDIPEELELELGEDGVVVSCWDCESEEASDLLQDGDRLLAIADRPVTSLQAAYGLFQSKPWTGPTTTIPVQILRGSDELTVNVPCSRVKLPGKITIGFRTTKDTVVDADGNEENILLVGNVTTDGPADKAGIQSGWRIVSINKQPVTSRLHWLKATTKLCIGDQMHLVLMDDDENKEHQITINLVP